MRTVAVYSEADIAAPHVREADEAVCIGPPPPQSSYLNVPAILAAAKLTGAGAIHPGYGFLSENAGFARQVEEAGIAFVGPTPGQLEAFGEKHTARSLARRRRRAHDARHRAAVVGQRGGRRGGRDRLPCHGEGDRRRGRHRHARLLLRR